jgi:2-polyprenyl-3-methyl-5-hydroxy-6-metoxy-1,4-benzoquinol methylase
MGRKGKNNLTAQMSAPHDGEPWQSSLRSYLPPLENAQEVAFLRLQHRYLSEQMGGVLPRALDLSRVRRVLDVACGVGAWVHEMAWQHPHMHITGIDRSAYLIEQAQKYNTGRDLPEVTYRIQDMFHLDGRLFAPGTFDLVHLRFLAGVVTPQNCGPLLQSLAALCRAGGYIVWTEPEFPITNSFACGHLCMMVQSALHLLGRSFSPGNSLGLVAHMGHWIRQAGCHILHDQAYAIDVSAGMPLHEPFMRQMDVFSQQMQPCLLNTGVATTTATQVIFSEMRRELHAESFRGLLFLRTLVGVRA